MKLLVGYNGGEEGRLNLSLAKEYASLTHSFVYIVTSMAGGLRKSSRPLLWQIRDLCMQDN